MEIPMIEFPTSSGPYEIRVTQLTVGPARSCLFDELSTTIELQYEASSEFVVVRQTSDLAGPENQMVHLDPKAWPALRQAIDHMMSSLRKGSLD